MDSKRPTTLSMQLSHGEDTACNMLFLSLCLQTLSARKYWRYCYMSVLGFKSLNNLDKLKGVRWGNKGL